MSRVQDFSLTALDRMVSGFLKRGSLGLIDAAGLRRDYGDGAAPRAVMRLADPGFYSKFLFNPELAVGEAYVDGALTFEDGAVRDLLEIFHMNASNLRGRPVRAALAAGARWVRRLQQTNPIAAARRNVAHHYDLSNEFYRLFLDAPMNYSCAYFEHPGQSLEAAQTAKLRRIAAKLKLEPGMRVLDIGCGWGAMALYLARHAGVDVVGVTLSREQHALAAERAREAGLAGKVEFRLADYRTVAGVFDRIVSVGMFEHVGAPHYDEFFATVRDLLAGDGLAVLHSIGRKNGPGTTGPWIRKYIFPGGYSPALSETFAAIERQKLWTTDIEILRLHYADTLKEWERRFQANRAGVLVMFDEKFCRMWEFYLAASEFAFRWGGHMVFQIQLAKRPDGAPLTRDYISQAEAALRLRDGG